LIDLKWNPDGTWGYATNEGNPGVLLAKAFDAHIKEVTMLAPSEAVETLGVWIAPDGNQTRVFQEMCNVAVKWADQIRPRRLLTKIQRRLCIEDYDSEKAGVRLTSSFPRRNLMQSYHGTSPQGGAPEIWL
jgi:hypothetical protein